MGLNPLHADRPQSNPTATFLAKPSRALSLALHIAPYLLSSAMELQI